MVSSQASLHVNSDNLFLTHCVAIYFQGAFYGGVVTKKRSLEPPDSIILFHVLYDDGDDEEVELDELKQMRLEVRHGVTVHFILARDQKVSCKYM